MKIEFINKKLVNNSAPVMILPIFDGEKNNSDIAEIDKKIGGFIDSIIKEGYFTPTLGQVHVLYTHDKIKTKKLVLVGLGKKADINEEKLYKAYSAAISYVGKTRTSECAVYIDKQNRYVLQNIVETILLALYRFHHHKSKKDIVNLKKITFIVKSDLSATDLDKMAAQALIMAEAIFCARDLSNHPSNYITPKKLAAEAKEIVKGKNVSVRTFGEDMMKELGMGLLLSVSKGSDEEAQMIVMDYKPKKYTKTIALVGKGLTFDSGGLSLKPTSPVDAMIGMNMDMGGAAAVIGVFSAISKIEPKNVRVVGIIPATENMVSGSAQKPGDVWKSLDGKTVEVLNTDAEGRLVLADAITYVQKNYKPDYMIDIATLTGACVVALGHEYTGLFSNNKTLVDKMLKNSGVSYEKLWHMPLADVHREDMKGEIADLKNIGSGREAGASTAAAFLEEFVDKNIAWAHMDVAGTAMLSRATRAYEVKGGTGAGVKTLLEFIANI